MRPVQAWLFYALANLGAQDWPRAAWHREDAGLADACETVVVSWLVLKDFAPAALLSRLGLEIAAPLTFLGHVALQNPTKLLRYYFFIQRLCSKRLLKDGVLHETGSCCPWLCPGPLCKCIYASSVCVSCTNLSFLTV